MTGDCEALGEGDDAGFVTANKWDRRGAQTSLFPLIQTVRADFMATAAFLKRSLLVPALLAATLALAGCSGGEEGADGAGGGAEGAEVPPASGAARLADDGGDVAIPVMGPERHILAFGNSLFAGYGFDEPDEDSYPAKLERGLRARGINARVVNAGVSGDTTAAGRQRLAFTLDGLAQKPDLVLLELGGNDLLRGLSPEETRANLAAMLGTLNERDIDVLLMGMRAPPNYGPEFQAEFDALYSGLAREYDADLIPFWLEAIYREPQLFQSDRIHPTVEGIEQLVSATLDEVAEALPEPASTASEQEPA